MELYTSRRRITSCVAMLEDGFQTILAIMYTINSGKTSVFVFGINVIFPLAKCTGGYMLQNQARLNARNWFVKQASLSITSGNPVRGNALVSEPGKIVDLRNTGISDVEVVNTIAAVLSKENHLQELFLEHNRIGDAGVVALSEALKSGSCKFDTL
eukprot:3311309-Amphidinium_carterae.1